MYLLPNYGSDTNWYKNLVVNPTLKISVNGVEIPARGELITDSNRVDDIMGKFKSKYGEVKQYYPKVNVAVEVSPALTDLPRTRRRLGINYCHENLLASLKL